jgi:hypothetical protein
VFYSVCQVALAFEILILQQQVAVQTKAAQAVGVVVRPTILDCPSDECGRDGKHRLVSVILVVAAFTAFWRQTEGQRGNP